MSKKVVLIATVAILATALVAGSLYVILQPHAVSADGRQHGRVAVSGCSEGYNNGHRASGRGSCAEQHPCSGHCNEEHGSKACDEAERARGRLSHRENLAVEWVTVEGQVTAMDDGEIVVQTAEANALTLHTGPEWYWEANDYQVSIGDELKVSGFYHEDEFEIGQIENLTSGQLITLRDSDGRPLWAGQGRWQH